VKSYRRVTEGDIKRIVDYLASYSSPEQVLSWRHVEQFSKFTRQALQAHPVIKEEFQSAKSRLAIERESRKNPKPPLDTQASSDLIEKLYERITLLEHQQELWRRRWFCIAYNIRREGVQMFDIDKPVPIGAKQLTDREIRAELARFDGDIPPVADRGE
jgi:hypothetical protein